MTDLYDLLLAQKLSGGGGGGGGGGPFNIRLVHTEDLGHIATTSTTATFVKSVNVPKEGDREAFIILIECDRGDGVGNTIAFAGREATLCSFTSALYAAANRYNAGKNGVYVDGYSAYGNVNSFSIYAMKTSYTVAIDNNFVAKFYKLDF